MVVLISGVSLAGYLALRLAGAKRSLPLIGVLGGLVSSTATTLVYARDSAQRAEIIPLAAAVIAIANLTVLVRLAVIGGIAAPDALPRLLPVRWQSRAAAVMAIVVAYLANIVFKFAIMLIAGSRALAWRCAPAFLTSSAGLLLGIAWV